MDADATREFGAADHCEDKSRQATVSVEEAARLLGIGRTLAYQLASSDQLPVPVIRIGRLLRVPTAPLRALLGLQ